MIIADQSRYEIIKNVKDGFKQEDFIGRFTDILSKYDYILGDWGYGQLRLKGFYEDKNQKASFDTRISTLQDYLYEYCNFGCAYFVLKKVETVTEHSIDDLEEIKVDQNIEVESTNSTEPFEHQKNIEQEQL